MHHPTGPTWATSRPTPARAPSGPPRSLRGPCAAAGARTRLGELLATPAPADAMTRLFEAGFHGVEVDSTDEHVVTPRFTATARNAAGVALHQAEGDTPRLALEALADLVAEPPPT